MPVGVIQHIMQNSNVVLPNRSLEKILVKNKMGARRKCSYEFFPYSDVLNYVI